MSQAKRSGAQAHRRRARRRALQALYQWQMTGQESVDIHRQFTEEQNMTEVDVEYFKTLIYEVPTRQIAIDEQLAKFLDRPILRVDPLERAVLRLAAFELLQRIEIPYRVVLDEAVDLAKDFGSAQSPIYVNGVLDRAAQAWRSGEYNRVAHARVKPDLS